MINTRRFLLKAPRHPLFTRVLVLLAVAGLTMNGPVAMGATFYWDTDGASAGSGAATGTWSSVDSPNWSTDATGSTAISPVTTTSIDDLFIAAGTNGTAGTITVSGAVLANSITFDDAVDVTISGGTSITLGGGGGSGTGIFQTANGANVISTGVILGASSTAFSFSNSGTNLLTIGAVTGAATSGTQTITVGSTSSGGITLNGIIGNGAAGGNVALLVNNIGSGTTTLSGANTFTGGVTLNAGTLDINNAAALGNTATGTLTVAGNSTINNTSGAAITTTTAKAINLNADLTFTGSNGLNFNGGTLSLGGTAGTRTLTVSGAAMRVNGIVGGSGFNFSKAGAGDLYLTTGTNNSTNVTGTVDISAGRILVSADHRWGGLTGAGTVTIGGSATKWLRTNGAFDYEFAGSYLNQTTGIRIGYEKEGTGTFTISGIWGDAASGIDTFGVTNGKVVLASTATVHVGGTNYGAVSVGTVANQSTILSIEGGTLHAKKTNSPGVQVGTVANSSGVVRVSSGALNSTSEIHLGRGNGTGAYAAMSVSGGTVTSGSWFVVGFNNDRSVLNQSGGSIVVTNNKLTIAAGGSGSRAVVNLSGGTFTANNGGSGGILVAERGTGVLNVSGTAFVTVASAGINIGPTGSQTGWNGTVNLLGGTIATNKVSKGIGTGTARFNFNGGTLRATAANTTFMTGLDSTHIHAGGAVIDSNGFDITIGQNLLAPTDSGVSDIALSSGGAGYIDMPIVTLSGGTGTGATAIANVSGGVVTGYTITNPGSGYSAGDVLTATLVGGGAATAAVAGPVTLAANSGGGLTKSGAGTLTLSGASTYSGATTVNVGTLNLTGSLMNTAIMVNGGAILTEGSAGVIGGTSSLTHASSTTATSLGGTNTYSGATVVNAGTLTLSGAGSINSSSGITINGSGAKFVQASSVAGTTAVTLTQGTLDGTGTVGAVTVGNGTGGIVSNGNGGTSTLTLGSLTFSGAGTINFRKVDDTATAALAIVGALTTTPANGQVTLNVLTPPAWNNGSTYNLVSYGSFGGANSDFALGVITGLGARQSATIGNTGAASGFITLAITGDTPFWTGLESSAWTTAAIGGSQNWKLQTAGTGTEFLPNDQVLFDDNATGTTDVTINDATVSPASVVFNNSTLNYTLSGSNGITSGTLAKSGTGTVTIRTANTYAGETNINGGMLIAGNGAALGSIAAGTTVASGATLDINSQNLSTEVLTISGSGVGGNGALVNHGASDQINATGRIVLAADATIGGTRRWDLRNSTPTLNMGGFTLTKTGANLVSLVAVGVSNAGHIVINQGRLNIETTTNLGGSSANTITVNSGATLGFWSATNAVTWSVALNDGSILQENGSSTISGPVALTGANTINVSGTSHTISGEISGTGSLTKTGGNVMTVSKLTNSYSGGTVVSAGRLAYDAGGSTGLIGNISPFGTGSVTVNSGAQLRLGTNVGSHNNTGFNIANAVTLDGGTVYAEDGIQHLTGTVDVAAASTLGSTYNASGADINKGLFLDGIVSGSADLTLQQSGISTGNNYNTSIVYFANNANTYSGTITVTPMGTGNGGGSYLGINAGSALANATVNLSGNNTSNAQQFGTSPIVFNTGLGTATLGALSGSGNVVLTGYNQSTHAYGADVIALDVGGNDADTSYSGVISGGGSLTKSGAGTMAVSGISTYTGATIVIAGTLEVTGELSSTSSTTVSGGIFLANNATGSATGSGNVTVQSGARLGGSGLVGLVTGNQSITVNSGGFLGIGNMSDIVGDDLGLMTSGTGVITFGGTLAFDIYDNLGGTSNLTSPLDTNDLLNLASDTSIVLGGTLKVTDLTGLSETWAEGDTWKLFDWTNVTAAGKSTGSFTTLDLPGLDSGLVWVTSTNSTGYYLTIAVVPEPSRMFLLAGGLMILLMRRRRIPEPFLPAGF